MKSIFAILVTAAALSACSHGAPIDYERDLFNQGGIGGVTVINWPLWEDNDEEDLQSNAVPEEQSVY